MVYVYVCERDRESEKDKTERDIQAERFITSFIKVIISYFRRTQESNILMR
jgi:hypothetical protein